MISLGKKLRGGSKNGNDIMKLSLVLNKLLEQQDLNDQEKHKIMQVIYDLETNLYDIKNKYSLHYLDNSIVSHSIRESFARQIKKAKQTNLIPADKTCEFKDYLRGLDYQYWFMIFLLLKNNEILEKNLTLHQIIDKFIDRIKDESFRYEDIMIMTSGATRCKTNLRFAVNSLRKAGLINYHDERHKQSWTLTYLGYFTAASFVYEPDEKRKNVFSKKISRIEASNWIFDLDPFIKNRIYQLAEPDYFFKLLDYLQINAIGLPMLENGYEIFGDYKKFFDYYEQKLALRSISKTKMLKLFEEFLVQKNKEYNLPGFMKELAMKFNAEEYFRELMELCN